jgi:FixJ family two-component response regulator
VAQTDKFLADADKTLFPERTYKARQFNTEPSFALTPLTDGGSAIVLDLFFMDSRNKTIAVVDDDHAVRQSLERLLNLVGYTVRTFAGAEEFLHAVKSSAVHCVVLDVDLGATSGLDLARHPEVTGAKIPVIFISGAVEDRIRTRATAAGCIALLSKPFKPVELLDAIFRATQDSPPIP